LHPTSLPGPYGIGEIGKEAFKFIDWVASTGMQMWQVLPLVPPETQYWSPYAGTNIIFCCNNGNRLPAISSLCPDAIFIPLQQADIFAQGTAKMFACRSVMRMASGQVLVQKAVDGTEITLPTQGFGICPM